MVAAAVAVAAVALAQAAGVHSLVDLAARAQLSTVRVDLEFEVPGGKDVTRRTVGSGVVVRLGVIATCAHLFDDLPGRVRRVLVVSDAGGREYVATLEPAGDPALDLAFLLVPSSDLAPAQSSEEPLRLGDEVFFIGHPFALSKPVLGVGAVASEEVEATSGAYKRPLYLLDGSVNKGNSGGAVFSRTTGALVGLVHIKAGAVGPELQNLMQEKDVGGIGLGGVDPVKAIQAVVREMDERLNMGVAGFLSIRRVLREAPAGAKGRITPR